MVVLIVTLLVVISLGVVLYPLLTRQARSFAEDDPAHALAEQLRRARDRIYEEIKTLQQEYFLKHLSEEEYQAQLEAARVQAALLLRQQGQVQQTTAHLEKEVEKEMRRARSGTPPEPSESHPRL